MSEFKKKTFGRRPSGGGFSRPSFGGARPGARDFGAPQERHQATCNKCGNTCEVPFRPNGKKPVYCRDCFVKDDDRSERPSFARPDSGRERPAMRPQPSNDRALEALSRQIAVLETKLDALTSKIEVLITKTKTAATPSAAIATEKAAAPKKARKPVKR